MAKDKSYRFLMPQELFEKAMAKARREDLTLAQVLRRFLREWVEVSPKRQEGEEP